MERRLKERLIGAAVLVMLAVIFIPMVLDNNSGTDVKIEKSNIPARPEDSFNSRIVPLEGSDLTPLPVKEIEEKEISVTAAETASIEKVEPLEAVTAEGEATLPEAPRATVETAIVPEKVVEEELQEVKESARAAGAGAVGTSAWVVQLGSFSSKDNASALNEKLRKAGYPAFVEPLKRSSGMAYRVRVGPELKRSNAQKLQEKLNKEMKIEGIVVRYP